MHLYERILTNFFCHVNPKGLSEYTLCYSKLSKMSILQFQIHVLIFIIMYSNLSCVDTGLKCTDSKVEYRYRKLTV